MPTTTSFWDHPIAKLEEALSIRKQIATLQSKLGSMFGGEEPTTAARSSFSSARTGRRSDKVRARMAAAQKARWAKIRGESGSGASTATSAASTSSKKKGRRTMSPEARERIAEAQRARWAKVKGSSTSPAASRAARNKPAGKSRGGKRTISPEGRARIAEAARQRWAKLKKTA